MLLQSAMDRVILEIPNAIYGEQPSRAGVH